MSKIRDCFRRGRRAEGVILYVDKLILGINRVYLLENTSSTSPVYNKTIAQKPMLSRKQINQIVRAQNSKDRNTLETIMNNTRTRTGKRINYAIIDTGRKLIVYVDKNYSNCKNLGGQIERGESSSYAFFREVYEETGYDLRIAINNGSTYDCLNGKFVITLNTKSYEQLLQSYNEKYYNHTTEIQTLFLGDKRIAGSYEYVKNGCEIHLNKNDSYFENQLYLKKYLKYKAKYLALKKSL